MSINVDDMAQTKQRGRPVGLLINTVAVRFFLGDEPQSSLAARSNVSPGGLSEILAGQKGVTREVADRLAEALEVPVGILFPELVEFSTAIRHFTAPKVSAA
jgi:transcriptional regulator with XRE-family HTH domain